jgi:hypothetical protein
MTKNRGCTSDIGQSYTGEPSKLVESDQLQDWHKEFNTHFVSLHRWIENRGTVGTKQAIKDFISNLIKKELADQAADHWNEMNKLEERVREDERKKVIEEMTADQKRCYVND